MNHSNFLMTPNIAFDVLTNEYDLVAYQKLLRVVGMNNTWKGGNHALAARLNTSYGRIVKLKAVLQKVGFIEIIPGDSAHGEADGWLIVDIWERNNAATLSRDVQASSPNEQGQATLSPNEQGQDPVKTCVSPCHETNNPLSPDEQATLSRNEQHKEKIYSEEEKELKNKRDLNADARENFPVWETEEGESFEPFAETANLIDEEFRLKTDRTLYWIQKQKQIQSRENFPATDWLKLLTDLAKEGIADDGFREFYQWAESQSWVETISPKLLRTQIEKFKKRASIQVKKQNGVTNGNGTIQQSYQDKRSQSAIDEHLALEQIRAAAEQRRAKPSLPNNGVRRG